MAVTARRESATIFLSRYARPTAPASLGGGRRPGAVSAGCGAGGGCKLPATHPSAFGRADLQDVAASRSITSAASCARPHPPTEDHLWRNARNWRARTSGLLRRFSLQVTLWRSAQINGLITSGSPIREPRFVSKAAARAELTCVRTSIGTSRLYYKLATPGGISKGANYD